MYWVFSILFHTWIWLFEFPTDVIFVISRLSLSVSGVLWRPPSRRGSFQFVPASWEPPTWNTRTPVSISCKHCFWKGALLSDKYIYFFFLLLTPTFVSLDELSLFHFVPYRNLSVWLFICCHFCVFSILFVSYWGPMEAMLSSWVLSNGPFWAHKLRAFNLKHNTVRLACANLTAMVAGKLFRRCLQMQAKISAGNDCLRFPQVTGENLPAPEG